MISQPNDKDFVMVWHSFITRIQYLLLFHTFHSSVKSVVALFSILNSISFPLGITSVIKIIITNYFLHIIITRVLLG